MRPIKYILLDTESTGLDPKVHGLLEIAALFCEFDGVKLITKKTVYHKTKPDPDQIWDPVVLEKFPPDMKEINSRPSQRTVFLRFIDEIEHFVDKYNKDDKAYFVAWNAVHDEGFVREWFNRQNHKFYGALFFPMHIDVLNILNYLTTGIYLDTYKLGEVCKLFGIPYDETKLHTADTDAELVRALFSMVLKVVPLPYFKEGGDESESRGQSV